MLLITVKGQTYHLSQLVRYATHVGQRGVGATTDLVEPEPIFGDFQFLELFFSDGSHVDLDEVQSRAFLKFVVQRATMLDLDKVDEESLGTILVHDTEEGGDIILPAETPEMGAPTIDVGISPDDLRE